MSRLIYAHAFPSSGDSHEVVVPFDDGALRRWAEVDAERAPDDPDTPGPWATVTDTTGKAWQIRSYPCGSPCHCAAQLRPPDAQTASATP